MTEIEDRLALAELSTRYARAVDSRQFGDLAQVFAADGKLVSPVGERQGLDAIAGAMAGLLAYRMTFHHIGQHFISELVPGERATTETYCEAHHLMTDGEDRADRVMLIRYDDTCIHTPEGWRIAERRLAVAWIDDRPVHPPPGTTDSSE